MSQLSRRQFLIASGASATSAVLLNGCFGNPPSATKTQETAALGSAVSAASTPETTKVKLGYLPIIESAPLIIAQQKGLFAKYGMTEPLTIVGSVLALGLGKQFLRKSNPKRQSAKTV